MSALLSLEAQELNILAEYGYCTRGFNKTPNVESFIDSKSCLFLVYQQPEYIPHRLSKYRNHFVLYTGGKNIVIVRTETTLIHPDNDAILTYDTITVSNEIKDRYRTSFKNWTVSFDKITYSNDSNPNLLCHEMLCSGEWWYFDKGIILRGKSGYMPNVKALELLIYFECHGNYRITFPKNNLIDMPPIFQQLIERKNRGNVLFSINNPPLTIQTTQNRNDENQENSSPSTQTINADAAAATASDNNANTNNLNLPFQVSSISPAILPFINATSRPRIIQNEIVTAPKVIAKSVIPALFWFDERQKELKAGKLSYFLPSSSQCLILKGQ